MIKAAMGFYSSNLVIKKCNMKSSASIAKYIKHSDIMIHMQGMDPCGGYESYCDDRFEDPNKKRSDIIKVTTSVLEACEKISVKRVVMGSSF